LANAFSDSALDWDWDWDEAATDWQSTGDEFRELLEPLADVRGFSTVTWMVEWNDQDDEVAMTAAEGRQSCDSATAQSWPVIN
jgi:hypothetical protein